MFSGLSRGGPLTLGAFGVVSCTSAWLVTGGITSVGGGVVCLGATCTPAAGSLVDPAPATPACAPATTITSTLLTGCAKGWLSCNNNLVRINAGDVDADVDHVPAQADEDTVARGSFSPEAACIVAEVVTEIESPDQARNNALASVDEVSRPN